jgi:hypothetical protein
MQKQSCGLPGIHNRDLRLILSLPYPLFVYLADQPVSCPLFTRRVSELVL